MKLFSFKKIKYFLYIVSVAAQVLTKQELKLSGYLLQLKTQQPELFLPQDKRKLFVENIDPKTSKDGLKFYMKAWTKVSVQDIWMGSNGKSIVVFDEDLGEKNLYRYDVCFLSHLNFPS